MTLVLDDTLAAESAEEACSLENYLALPDHSMDERIGAARAKLGASTVILGHHYQRDEVVRFADYTGDSYKLSKAAAATEAKYIVFCGVHFMAESADVLARPEGQGQPAQQVILPDLNAGCSMADMAEISQVEACWESLSRMRRPWRLLTDGLIPVTYINSTAAIKAFCGERGGLVCTSSNARAAMEWAFARGKRILFLPDQHLGRNTGYAMGIPLDQMTVWDPWALAGRAGRGGLCGQPRDSVEGPLQRAPAVPAQPRGRGAGKYPGIQVIAHPECRWEVCQKADALGSTEGLIALVEKAPEGAMFAVGTEIHLVNRLAKRVAAEGKRVITLDDTGCLCTTMYRISPQHLCWVLENLVEGRVVNRIQVGANVKHWGRVALDRMLEAAG